MPAPPTANRPPSSPSKTGAAITDILSGQDSGRVSLEEALDLKVPDRTLWPHADRPPSGNSRTSTRVTAPFPIKSVADLGALIKRARQRSGLNQQRFADLAGVGRRFVSELEAGKPSLEAEKVISCCLVAGIDIFAQPRTDRP